MKEEKFEFKYLVFESENELPKDLNDILQKAKAATNNAHAPYSKFYVGAAARLSNGEIVTGSNQENASFPIGLCAERTLLATASSLFPKVSIDIIAVSYKGDTVKSNHPISPCGICRQSLQEFETRAGQPLKMILSGMEGQVYLIEGVNNLLPLAFTSENLTK